MSSVHRICGDFVRLYFPKLRTRIGYGDGVNFILFRIEATFDYSIYSSFQPNYHQAKSERHETFPLNLTHSNFIDAIHDSFVRFWLPMLFNMKLSDEHCPPDWKMFLRYSGLMWNGPRVAVAWTNKPSTQTDPISVFAEQKYCRQLVRRCE